jgi:hypothetical protein
MPSYLEIALSVARRPQAARDERKRTAHQPHTASVAVVSPVESADSEMSALCGSQHCAGCYEVAPAVRIHPPESSQEWARSRLRWEPKGNMQ